MRAIISLLFLLFFIGNTSAATVTNYIVTVTSPAIMGDPNIEAAGDNGNGNLLLAQTATLSTAATLQSLSLYVTTAAGNLVLAVYDSTGSGGKPGKLVAQTSSFAAKAGWNTVVTTAQPVLAAGNYWLVYGPSSSSLGIVKQNNSGNCYYYSHTFSATLPATFATSPATCTPTTWSFYATLGGAVQPPVNGVCGTASGTPVYLAPTVNLCSTGPASAVSGFGPWLWTCSGSNGGTTASCSAPLNADGPSMLQLSNTTIGTNNAGMTVGAISTVPPGYPGVVTLGGADGSSFALTNGGHLPSNLVVGPTSLPAGAYQITLTAN